jgi:hypothetical protein
MWMDSYVQDTLIRDQIKEAQRQAARRQLLRLGKPSRAAGVGAFMRRLTDTTRLPRLKQLIERMPSS